MVRAAGLSDWQSYYGENLIDQWMIPYFGAPVYDDPAVYTRSSPITLALCQRACTSGRGGRCGRKTQPAPVIT